MNPLNCPVYSNTLCFEDIEKWPLKSRLVDFGQFAVKTDAISPNLHLEAQKKFMDDLSIHNVLF